MNAVKPISKLTSIKAVMTAFMAIDLFEYLKTIQANNKSLSSTASKWIYKNCKKLNAVLEKHQPKENAIVEEYAEKTDKGNTIFWDGYEEEIKQRVGDADKIVFGARAYLDKSTKSLKFVVGDVPLNRQQAQMYAPYIKDVVRRAEYLERKKAINGTMYNVQLEKIDAALLEGLALPSPDTSPSNSYEILDLVYENLVNVDEDDTEVTEVVEETNDESTEKNDSTPAINPESYKAEGDGAGNTKSNLTVAK